MSPLAHVAGFPAPSGPLDLRIGPGDVVLLRGPNGSGKTSLLRALAGLDAPLAPARALVGGADARALPAAALAARVALACQDARDALVGLTVEGEFRLRERPVAPACAPLARRDSATLSSGEARRVNLALAAGAPVPLLLLDEPAEGLDAAGRGTLRALVASHAAKGGAVVAADHGGLLDDLATRELRLGEHHSPALPDVPRPDGPIVLSCDAATLRGRRLPALALGPGLHALTGPNGCGKSTALARLAGLLPPHDDVRVAGAPPSPGRNVRLALPHARDGLLLRERVHDECPAPNPLVPDALRERHPAGLSGGEAQRVALAKALGAPAPVYLLDEPEAHLDADGRVALVREIARVVREGACVVVATHDEALATLARTRIVMEAPA